MNYHLVIEYRPGDFMPVDINILLNVPSGYNFCMIENIDMFTKKYTLIDLMKMIKEANIVPEKYLNGSLTIINDNKYRYEVLTLDNNKFALDEFIKENINDKQIMNKIVNIYQKYSDKNIETLKMGVKNTDYNLVLSIIFALEYINIRSIYIYVLENIIK